MLPKIFGFIDSYSLMIFIGVVLCMLTLFILLKKDKYDLTFFLDISFSGILAIIVGIIFACLFENLYEFVLNPESYSFTFGMTFYGGLFGGVLTFLIMYFFSIRKKHKGSILEILKVAPACILIAHALGRIGCFMAGCCYGKPTNSWIGIEFSTINEKVIPTNLIEAIFLLMLFIFIFILTYKFNFKYSITLYMILYGIFRFIIEFFRGDDRGAFLGPFSPSQVWCFALVILSVPIFILVKYFINHEKNINF